MHHLNLRLLALAGIVILVGLGLAYHQKQTAPVPTPRATPTATATASPSASPTATPSPSPTPAPFAAPIAEFKQRATKKFFGTYITPQTSPVQPERFTGYHTGVDIEYTDVTADVPVYAIADGAVRQASTVSGYGGLLVIEHPGAGFFSLYGHMRVSSLPAVGTSVTKGQQIGVLGTGYSSETDGERRHLHFGIPHTLDIRGYVQSKGELSGWTDPLSLY